MNWKKNILALLLILVVGTSLMMTVAGVAMKYLIMPDNEQVKGTLAVAVPLLYLRGDLDMGQIGSGEEEPPLEETGDPTAEEPSEEASWTATFSKVEEDYFDTALFIGDSRTVGLALYGRLGQADYFADVGMSVFNLFDKSVSDDHFAKQDLRSLLGAKQYETIYLMLGINEVGYPHSSIEKKLDEIIAEVQSLQPNALIVLQANLMVTEKKEAAAPILNKDSIQIGRAHV